MPSKNVTRPYATKSSHASATDTLSAHFFSRLDQKFGGEFANLRASEMTHDEREELGERLWNRGLARRLQGLPPFRPLDNDDDDLSITIAHLTDSEASMLFEMVQIECAEPQS